MGGYPGAIVFAGDGVNSCHCRTPIETYHGALGPRVGLAYSLNDRTVLRAAYGINYSRRGAVGGRAGARNGTGTLGFSANASFPSANTFDPSYNWDNGVPSYAAPPFFDPSLNAGFVTGRGTGGTVTYGDPAIGGRPPRYQNFNAGFQYALTPTVTVGATYAGSRGDFLGGSGRGFYSNQLDPRFLVLGNLLTQPATPSSIAAAQAVVSGVALPYAGFSGTIAQMLRPFPQYSGVTDVYGDVARSTYHSLQLTVGKRRSDDGLMVNFNYTFSRTEDNLAARTGYDFDQDWSVGVNDQPHVWNAMVVYKLPFGADAQRQQRPPGDRQGLADLRHHAVPVGAPARSDWRRLQPAERRHVLRRFQPGLHGRRPHQRQLRRRRRARDEPAVVHRQGGVPVARPVHVREHPADPCLRSPQPKLFQPGSQPAS